MKKQQGYSLIKKYSAACLSINYYGANPLMGGKGCMMVSNQWMSPTVVSHQFEGPNVFHQWSGSYGVFFGGSSCGSPSMGALPISGEAPTMVSYAWMGPTIIFTGSCQGSLSKFKPPFCFPSFDGFSPMGGLPIIFQGLLVSSAAFH